MDVGDTVLHPRYGVGVIDSIEKRSQDGETRDYYVIPKPSIASTIFVPVDAAAEVGLRPVSSAAKLQKVVDILTGEDKELKPAVALRNLSWGDPLALAQAIRHKATEPKPRYPKVSEQHQLKRAKRLLTEEMSAVLGMAEESVMALLEGESATDGGRATSRK